MTRLTGNTSATITWYQATDNSTANANIVYSIFYDAAQGNVFVGSPEKTVTGALTTNLTGLDALTEYYVGVRAKDEAENAETNTRTMLLAPLPNAVRGAWTLYQ